MARRRLTPPRQDFLAEAISTAAHPHLRDTLTDSHPPIAQVAGQAAMQAALDDLAADVTRTRLEGRIIEKLPIAEIDAAYLVRDRQMIDTDEMEALITSIRSRGQQMPIEVVDKGAGREPRYGLISGWRRLEALRRIDPSSDAMAIIRRPETAADAYVAMVEENEIRAGISYYERARIVTKSIEAGVYPDARTALHGLFGNVSRAKRSKIKSFTKLVSTLDAHLKFPAAISEKTGLSLVKAIDEGQSEALISALKNTPVTTAADELATLTYATKKHEAKPPRSASPRIDVEVSLDLGTGHIVLSGTGVGPDLEKRLRRWLRKLGA